MTNKPIPVKLDYSSPEKRKEYRGAAGTAIPSIEITYQEVATDSLSGKTDRQVQKRLQGRIALVPDFDSKGQVTVKALIDRMKIKVCLDRSSNANAIRAAIRPVLKQNKPHVKALHGAGHASDREFEITLQEPQPEEVADVWRILTTDLGAVANKVTLIELSLDFWPRKKMSDAEKLHFREKMVRLLQRHHWCETHGQAGPKSDARQVYQRGKGGKFETTTAYLFPVKGSGGRHRADWDVMDASVQERLSRPQLPTGLFLDSTLYKGRESAGALVRIQHKVTNRNNRSIGTLAHLFDHEKRARIEVELHADRLASEFNLVTLNDLTGFNFRQIRNSYLQFWYPTADPNTDEIEIMRGEMPKRGIYAVELRQRVRGIHFGRKSTADDVLTSSP